MVVVFTMVFFIWGIILSVTKWVVKPIKHGFGFLESVTHSNISQSFEDQRKEGLNEIQDVLVTIQGNLRKGMARQFL